MITGKNVMQNFFSQRLKQSFPVVDYLRGLEKNINLEFLVQDFRSVDQVPDLFEKMKKCTV